MWNMEKVTLVTNNDRVYEKYREDMEVLLLDSYRDVLLKSGIWSMTVISY